MSQSVGKTVARAGLIMMISLLLSRVLGLIRVSVMSGVYGQNALTDAYRISFQLPDLIFFLVAGGALSSAFIPVFTEYLATDREEEAWKVFSAVATIMAIAITVLIGVMWIFAPQIAVLIAPGRTDIHADIAALGRVVLPAQIAFFMGALMFGTLYAKGIFSVPGLGPNIYNIGIITGALTLSHFVTPNVMGASWGALIGAVIGNIVVPLFAMKAIGLRYRFSLDTKHPGVRKVFRLMLPVILGLSLPSLYGMIMQYFAAQYPAGVSSALDNANQLMSAPLAIFGQSMALAVFPALATFFAQQKMAEFSQTLSQTARTTIYLALPSAAILVFLPVEIVRALLEHGRFTAENTLVTAPLVQALAAGVVFWCLQPVLMRAFFAVQDTVTPILLGTATTVVFVGLCLAAKAMNLPAFSLAVAGSLAALLLVILMFAFIRRKIAGLDAGGMIQTAGLATAASAGAGLFAWGLMQGFGLAGSPGGKLGLILALCLTLLLTAWVYYFLTKALKMPETKYFERALGRLNRKGSDEPAGG